MAINRFGVSPYPPGRPPLPPVPDEIGDQVQHGINCVCVAEHFGLDTSAYGSTSGCGMPQRAYAKLLGQAQRLHTRSKRRRLTGDARGALEDLQRVFEIGEQIDSIEAVLGASSDASEVLFGVGDVGRAEQSARLVLDAMPTVHAGLGWVQAGATVRQIEECRDIAERTMIRVLVDRGEWAEAEQLIERQRTRFGRYREIRELDPQQMPEAVLEHHRVMDLLLRFEEVHVLIGTGDRAAAERACLVLLDDVRAMRADPPASFDAGQNLPVIEAEVTMQLETLRLHAGRGASATAGLARLASELRSGSIVESDSVAMHAAIGELALVGGVPDADASSLESAIVQLEHVRQAAAGQHRVRDVAEASARLGALLIAMGDADGAQEQLDHAQATYESIGEVAGLRALAEPRALLLAMREDWAGLDAVLDEARRDAAGDVPRLVRLDGMHAASVLDRDRDASTARLALQGALPAALAADALRYRFDTETARSAWARSIAAPALAVAVAAAEQAGDERVLAELVERQAQVGAVTVTDGTEPSAPTPPPPARDELALAASLDGVVVRGRTRLAPPRPLRWTPLEGSVLSDALAVAAERYGLDDAGGEPVPTW